MKYVVKAEGEPTQVTETAAEARRFVDWRYGDIGNCPRPGNDTITVVLDTGKRMGSVCGDEFIVSRIMFALELLRKDERHPENDPAPDPEAYIRSMKQNMAMLLDGIGVKHTL